MGRIIDQVLKRIAYESIIGTARAAIAPRWPRSNYKVRDNSEDQVKNIAVDNFAERIFSLRVR